MPIEGKLKETPQNFYDQFSQNPFELQPSQNEKMMDLFLKAFAEDSLLADAKTIFHQNYNAETVDSAMQWIRTENTQDVLNAEQEFYSIQGIRKRVVHKYELEQNPPPENRYELISSLAQNMSVAETEVESRAIIFRAMVSAFSELSDQQSFTADQIEGFVNNYRNQISSQVDQEVINQLMLMYHEMENNILKQYAAFYETKPGMWLNSTISEAINTAYRAAADRFLKSLPNVK